MRGAVPAAGQDSSAVGTEGDDSHNIRVALENPARLPAAKTAIRRFQDELSAILEGDDATEVYQLGVQLFPLSKKAECP